MSSPFNPVTAASSTASRSDKTIKVETPSIPPADPNNVGVAGSTPVSDGSKFLWEEHTWNVMESMTKQDPYFWVKHQIESFDNFLDTIGQIIKHNSPIVININESYDKDLRRHKNRCVVTFNEIFMSAPLVEDRANGIKRMLPNMARQRDLTYAATLYVDVTQEWFEWSPDSNRYESTNHHTEEKVPLTKIPIMVGSKYCYLYGLSPHRRAELGESEQDSGGYFVVNGTEKVVIAFERPRENAIRVYPTKSNVTAYVDRVEVKSTQDQRFFPIRETSAFLLTEKNSANGIHGQEISVKIKYIRNEIPLFVVFRALGVISDKAIMELILHDVDGEVDSNFVNLLLPSANKANKIKSLDDPTKTISIRSQEDALRYIAHPKNLTYNVDYLKDVEDEARLTFAKSLLDKEFLPHMNPPNGEPNNRKKAFFLGHMIRQLLECHLGIRPYDDRDHYSNKRLNTTGPLLAKIFTHNFKRLVNKIKTNISKQSVSDTAGNGHRGLRKDIQSCTIETALKYALSTGNWATSKSGSTSSADKGVAQVLQRLTPYSALSHLRRIVSPLERAGSKLIPPRKLHPTQFGMICPNETPEGAQVGTVKNMAMSVYISIPTSTAPIYACLNELGIRLLEEIWVGELKAATSVFVNGHYYGILPSEIVPNVYRELKLLKRDGTFDIYTSISWNIEYREMHILTDGGRYCRPLYVVEENMETGEFEPVITQRWNQQIGTEPGMTYGKALIEKRMKWNTLVTGTGATASICSGGDGDTYEERLTKAGVIEYLDTAELATAMIATTAYSLKGGFNIDGVNRRTPSAENPLKNTQWTRYNYLELHPIMILGVISQMIPFSDHNPSPRNCYQCLWKEEHVLMADGETKRIADIRVGDQVITVDPDTAETSVANVINQYVRPTEKQIVKITTHAGRSLTCTEDHPILTLDGWKKAGSLTESDLICINPNNSETYTAESRNHEALTAVSGIMLKNDCIYVPFRSCEPVSNVEIADITIDNPWHSFVTGSGIVVHNSSMGKQALGVPTTNFNSRFDTNNYVLLYVQRPLVNPRTMSLVGFDELPTGQQVMVAIMTWTGYNQEDSVMLNGSALDRGRMNILASKTYKDKESKKAANALRSKTAIGGREKFMKPSPAQTKDMRVGSYAHLDESGFAKPGSKVSGGAVVIGKTIELSSEEQKIYDKKYKDISKNLKKNDYGIVDKVIDGNQSAYVNSDGEVIGKLRVIHRRKPIIGDKFAARSAQKGTCGMIYNQHDMPFSAQATVPDLIMNPHAIPSRMTIGQILEGQAGKVACHNGEYVDASSFTEYPRQRMEEDLVENGFQKNGDEIVYNPHTGEQMRVPIYITPTYYQRLKHMVDDKVHARDRGPVTLLTRQPQEGRSRDGGLRVGEMERDALIAHGVAFFLKERMVDFSDLFRVYVSKRHKAIVMANPDRDFYMYGGERLSKDEVREVQIPYACKLLFQELGAMGVKLELKVN